VRRSLKEIENLLPMSNKGSRKRILTGDRPTGRLHLGHYVGSLINRVKLQDEYETILVIADLHTLTTNNSRSDIERIGENARGIVIDYIGAGINPEKTIIYLQSAIPEIYELNTLFGSLVTVNRLSRLPSLKDMAKGASIDENSIPFALLGYPVLQAADILLPKADLVPVGKDNEAHVEITREIARKFNSMYGEIFSLPEVMLGETASLAGTDGQAKMSKSLNNVIMLCDEPEVVAKKVRGMYTDPNRVRADIPGAVEGNPVFAYHDAFNSNKEEVEELKQRYRAGKVGDVEVKERLVAALNGVLDPIRERMAKISADLGLVDEIILDGTRKMQEIARSTMKEVRKAIGIDRTMVRLKRNVERRSKQSE
jgi:tryptophanyl-tRNA synthetase